MLGARVSLRSGPNEVMGIAATPWVAATRWTPAMQLALAAICAPATRLAPSIQRGSVGVASPWAPAATSSGFFGFVLAAGCDDPVGSGDPWRSHAERRSHVSHGLRRSRGQRPCGLPRRASGGQGATLKQQRTPTNNSEASRRHFRATGLQDLREQIVAGARARIRKPCCPMSQVQGHAPQDGFLFAQADSGCTGPVVGARSCLC